MNYDLSEISKQVECLQTSAEKIKSFLDGRYKFLCDLRERWGKFEIYFSHAEEIFKEFNEVME